MESKVLKAYLNQTKINDVEVDKRDSEEKKADIKVKMEAIKLMNRDQSISKYVSIPTNNPIIEEPKKDNKNKYNGNLEKVRWLRNGSQYIKNDSLENE